jgi:hypothetical protein
MHLPIFSPNRDLLWQSLENLTFAVFDLILGSRRCFFTSPSPKPYQMPRKRAGFDRIAVFFRKDGFQTGTISASYPASGKHPAITGEAESIFS